jgi:hypothetical protein
MSSASAVYRAECVFVRKPFTTFQPLRLLILIHSDAIFRKTQHDQRIKHKQSRKRLTSLGKRSSLHIESDFPAAHRYSNNWNLILTEQDRPLLDFTSTLKHESGKPHFVISANY